MILEIETAIKTKLEEIPGIKQVFDYYTLEADWYPYASFEMWDFKWEYQDVSTILRQINFPIVIIQEVWQLNRNDAKRFLYEALEKCIEMFDWEMELWNKKIVNGLIMEWDMWTFEWAEWNTLAISLKVWFEFESEMWKH